MSEYGKPVNEIKLKYTKSMTRTQRTLSEFIKTRQCWILKKEKRNRNLTGKLMLPKINLWPLLYIQVYVE